MDEEPVSLLQRTIDYKYIIRGAFKKFVDWHS